MERQWKSEHTKYASIFIIFTIPTDYPHFRTTTRRAHPLCCSKHKEPTKKREHTKYCCVYSIYTTFISISRIIIPTKGRCKKYTRISFYLLFQNDNNGNEKSTHPFCCSQHNH